VSVSLKTWAMGQYSRFIRPGYVRVEADSNPVKNVYLTAFRNPESDLLVLVVINMNSYAESIDINLSGFKAKSYKAYRTSEFEKLVFAEHMETLANGESFNLTLKEYSVTTYVIKQKTKLNKKLSFLK